MPILVAGQTHFEEVSKPNLQNNELKGNSILHNSSKINAAKNSGMAFLGFEVKNIALDYTEEMIPTSIEK
ncbi:hypothetical protein H9X57_03585 [Flavobacterium piscinae]|uniref:hypothetical protein n=1 Tax=Flavobacterium piscinae TaxID=2506424 RepID=UPI0019B3A8A7|nr:hypothetical protein [Flavobacterium piscinae]MBC8882800.1 hypothetical protein [Flavobacterium piscinae]